MIPGQRKMIARVWVVPDRGDEIAGVRVTDYNNVTRGRDRTFQVIHLCCGEPGEIGQEALRKRLQAGSTMCRDCARRSRERAKKVSEANLARAALPVRLPARRFTVGEEVAGLTVLETRDCGGGLWKMRYQVRHGCCGKVAFVSHKTITERARTETTGCLKCARNRAEIARSRRNQTIRKAGADWEPYGVVLPLWPRPPSVAPGFWVWGT